MGFRKKLVPLFQAALFCFFAVAARAQESLVWAKNYPATPSYNQAPISIAADPDGNAYLLYLRAAGSFLPGQTADWHLSKISPNGSVLFDNVIDESDASNFYSDPVFPGNPVIRFSKGVGKTEPRVTLLLIKYAANGSTATIFVQQFDLLGNPLFAAPVQASPPSNNYENFQAFDVGDDGTVYLAYDDLKTMCFDTISNTGIAQPLVTTSVAANPQFVQHMHYGNWLLGNFFTWDTLSEKTGQLLFSGPTASGNLGSYVPIALPNGEIMSVANKVVRTNPRVLNHVVTLYSKEGKQKRSTQPLTGWVFKSFIDPSGHHIYLSGLQLNSNGNAVTSLESLNPDLKVNWAKPLPTQWEWADNTGFFVAIDSDVNTSDYGAKHTLATLTHYNLDGTLDGNVTYSPPASSALILQLSATRGDTYAAFFAIGLTDAALPQPNAAFQLVRLSVK